MSETEVADLSGDDDQTWLLDQLRRDLAGFADPGTIIDFAAPRSPSNWLRARWEMAGIRRDAEFRLGVEPDLRLATVEDDGVELSYPAFLAGSKMADLRGLARNLLGSLRELENYVPSQAQLENSEDALGLPNSADALLSEIAHPAGDLTHLVFVTASAGVGKTSLLTQATRRAAELYRTGQATQLWLYVDAQGRRLAKLDDAVSGDLGKARARFSFDAIPALVRVGAVVLVIDGFDELLGTSGSYDESFSSLASFLDELRGSGCVIAAARSAYYEQEFVARVNSAIGFRSEGWTLTRMRLLDWTDRERDAYVRVRLANSGRATEDDYESKVGQAFAHSGIADLAGNPFFVTRTVDLLSEGEDLSGGATLLERLVNSYLRREAEQKLRERQGHSYLTMDQLRDLFAEIAEEMWRQDAVELSRTSLRELLSVWLDLQDVDREAQLAVVDRGPYAALLVAGSSAGSVRFEHDVYYAYFLAEPLVQVARLGDPLRIRQALRRGRLPTIAAELAGRRLSETPRNVIGSLIAACERQDASTEQVRQNAGTIVAGTLVASDPLDGLELRSLDFTDSSLASVVLNDVSLRSCVFDGSDLRGFTAGGTGKSLSFERSIVDPLTTRFRLEGVPSDSFRGLQVEENGRLRTIYAPQRLIEVLAACELPAAAEAPDLRMVPTEVLAALQSVVRIYSRSNLMTETDDTPEVERLTGFASWPTVREAMLKAGVLTRDIRSASGRKSFLRIHVDPTDLLAGQDSAATVPNAVRAMWEALDGSGLESDES